MGSKTLGFETNASTGVPLTDGQTANTAASGATTQSNGTQTYAATAKYEGNLGLKIVTASVATTISRFAFAASNLSIAACVAFTVDASPTATFTVPWTLRNSTGPALRFCWASTGLLYVRGQGTTTTQVQISGNYTPGTQYVATVTATAGTSTTGSYTFKIYNAATRALVGSATSTTSDLGTTAFSASDIGFGNSDPQIGRTNQFDALTLVDGTTTEVTPASWAAPTGPVTSVWDGSSSTTATVTAWDGTGAVATTISISN